MNKVEFSRTVKPAFAKRYGNFIGANGSSLSRAAISKTLRQSTVRCFAK